MAICIGILFNFNAFVFIFVLAPLVGHVGDGNFHLFIVLDPNNPEEKERAIELSHRVARWVAGHCIRLHAFGASLK